MFLQFSKFCYITFILDLHRNEICFINSVDVFFGLAHGLRDKYLHRGFFIAISV